MRAVPIDGRGDSLVNGKRPVRTSFTVHSSMLSATWRSGMRLCFGTSPERYDLRYQMVDIDVLHGREFMHFCESAHRQSQQHLTHHVAVIYQSPKLLFPHACVSSSTPLVVDQRRRA